MNQPTTQLMNDIPEYIENACNEIDAAIFSGDCFTIPERRKFLREYMERWERELKEWDDLPTDEE